MVADSSLLRMAEGLCYTFKPTGCFNRSPPMRRIGSLPSSCFQPALLLRMGKQSLKQQRFPSSLQQPAAKLTQDRKVKAEILQVQAQRGFAMEPGPQRVGSLPIGKAFHKLQHCHQRQPPWRFSWLSPARKESNKQLILKHCTQFISDPQARVALWADHARQASGVFGNRGQWFGFERHAGSFRR